MGGSYGGLTCAQGLWDSFDVTVIDRNDYFQHTQGTIKLAHDTELPSIITIPYKEIVEGNKNRFQFRQATLT